MFEFFHLRFLAVKSVDSVTRFVTVLVSLAMKAVGLMVAFDSSSSKVEELLAEPLPIPVPLLRAAVAASGEVAVASVGIETLSFMLLLFVSVNRIAADH